MANQAQKAILSAKIAGVLKDLMIKTTASQVYIDDTTTLAAKLADVITALNGKALASHTHAQADISGLADALSKRPTTTDMNTAISGAISDLIGGAPETYDTLKEIADYIAENGDVVDALNKAIGNKADNSTVTALQSIVDAISNTVNALGSLATKDSVSYSDLDSGLKSKIDAATNAKHTHSNKSVLDAITAAKVEGWDGKTTVYYSAEEPAMADGDIWMQLID